MAVSTKTKNITFTIGTLACIAFAVYITTFIIKNTLAIPNASNALQLLIVKSKFNWLYVSLCWVAGYISFTQVKLNYDSKVTNSISKLIKLVSIVFVGWAIILLALPIIIYPILAVGTILLGMAIWVFLLLGQLFLYLWHLIV